MLAMVTLLSVVQFNEQAKEEQIIVKQQDDNE